MPSDFYTTLKTTALAQLSAAADPNPWDLPSFLALRAPTCVHTVHPQSALPPPINKPLNYATFNLVLQTFSPVVASWKADVKDCIVDTETRVVVLRLAVKYVLRGVEGEEGELGRDVEGGMETVWILEMDQGGEKIVRMEEMLDARDLMREGGTMDRGARYQEWLHRKREEEEDEEEEEEKEDD